MLYFKNLQSKNNSLGEGLDNIDNGMANVSSQLDFLRDKLNDLGSSEHFSPLINELEKILGLVSQVSQADVSNLERGLLTINSSIGDFYNKINSMDANKGLGNIVEDLNKIKNLMSETVNSFQVSTITNQINQLTSSLNTILEKGNEVSKTFKDIKFGEVDVEPTLKRNIDSVERFFGNYKSKIQELQQLSSNVLSIDKNASEQEYMTAFNSIKQKATETMREISSEINFAESIKNQLDIAGIEVKGFNEVIIDLKKNLLMTTDSFNIDISSLRRVNEEFKLTEENIKNITSGFSSLKSEMESNTRNVDALNQVIKELNTSNSDITFNTNAKDLLNDVKDISDVVTNLMGKVTTGPQDFLDTFQRIKNDVLELRKMEQSLAGASVNSGNGMLVHDAIRSDRSFAKSSLDDIAIIEDFGKQFLEMFKSYGNTYKDEVTQLESELKDLRSQRRSMISSQKELKVEGFKNIIDIVQNPDEELSKMLQFQLLGKNLHGNQNKHHVGVSRFINDVNHIGTNALVIENSSRDLQLKMDADLSGLSRSDKRNIENTLGMSTEDIIEYSQEIQRMVLEFNKSKENLTESIGQAVKTGNTNDIEDAKQQLEDLLSFGEKLTSKSQVLGNSLNIKDKDKFKELPEEAKALVAEIQKSIKNSKDLTSESIKLGDAFGVSTKEIREMNNQLIGVDNQLNNIGNSALTFSNIMSKVKNNSFTKTILGASKGLTSTAAILGVGGLSIKGLVSQSANYYKDVGNMDVDTFSTDMMLGRDFSKEDARNKSYTKALEYYDMSGGLIDFKEYQKMYSNLVKSVGGQNGISGDQVAKDLDLITNETIGLSKVYGISDSTIQEATKLFYKDLKMSAKDTSDTINELVQVARTANVPIDKYISQITQMAESYKNVGLSGKDASNVMNKLLIDGMNQDAASTLAQGIGGAVGNFSTNTNMMAYYGMLSGQFSDPFAAIRFGLDKYDPVTGNVREGYGEQMAQIMDTQLGLMSSITGADENMNFWNVYNQFKNVYGMSDKQASIATSKYISGDREGFTEYLEKYSEEGEVVKLQGQEEIEEMLRSMQSNLAETSRLENELREKAFQSLTVIENLSETFIAPFTEAIDGFGDGVDKFIGGINSLIDVIGGLGGRDGFSPMTIIGTALGLKAAPGIIKGGSNLVKKIGRNRGKLGKTATELVDNIDDLAGLNRIDDVGNILRHGDELSDIGKLAKKGGKYAAIAALFGGGALALNGIFGNDKLESEYSNWNIPNDEQNNFLSATNLVTTVGLEGAISKGLDKALTKTIGGSLGKLSYGVGDALFAVGDVVQHKIQGDYIKEDIGENAVQFGFNAGGSIAGAAIGSLAGPIGTAIGGVLGAFTTDILNVIKLDNGRGLGTTISDSVTHAVTGYTSEEIEYKRAMVNNPQEMLKHRLELAGISREQSGTISQAMVDHSDKLEGLTEEQIDAWAQMYSGLLELGESNENIIKQLDSIFSQENLNSVLNSLGYTIGESVKQAFPNGISTQDTIELEQTRQDALNKSINENLNNMQYLNKHMKAKGITNEQNEQFKKDIYDNPQIFYDTLNNPNSPYYETAKGLYNELLKDGNKVADKAADKKYEQIQDEQKEKEYQQRVSDSELKSNIASVFANSDESLLKYLKEESKELENRLKRTKKGSLDYELISEEKTTNDRLIEYVELKNKLPKEAEKEWNKLASEERATAEKKGKLDKYDPNRINQFDWVPFNEKTKDKFISDYIADKQVEAGFIGSIFDVEVKPQHINKATNEIFASIKDGKSTELEGKYGKNMDKLIQDINNQDKNNQKNATQQLKEQIDTNEKLFGSNFLKEKMREDLKSQAGLTTQTNLKIDETNKLLEQNLAKIGNGNSSGTSTINSSSSYVPLTGDIANIDTKANMLDFSGQYGYMNERGAAEVLDQMFRGTGLEGMGKTYVKYGKEYGVDPYLMASISMHETGSGTSDAFKDLNNVGGIRKTSAGKDYELSDRAWAGYNTIENGIKDLARILDSVYYKDGLTSISQIQQRYAPLSDSSLNTHWIGGVSKFYSQLTGLTDSIVDNVTIGTDKDYANQTINNSKNLPISSAMTMIAAKQVGSNYVWGGESMAEGGFDCSGLVHYAANMAGMNIGRMTADGLWKSGKVKQISKAELQMGDLGFRDDGGKMGHVGIYDGNGGWIHAANSNDGVVHDKSSQWTHYGRLEGSDSKSTVDWSKVSVSSTGGSELVGGNTSIGEGGFNSSTSGSETLSFEQQLANTSAFNKGGMLYDFAPSNYSSYFSRDPSVKSNYPKAITDMYQSSGGGGLTIPNSQAISRALREQMDSSWAGKDDPYAETISDISKYQSEYASQNTKAKAAIDVNIISPDNLSTIESKLIDHIKSFKLDDSSLDLAINEYLGPIISAIQDVSGGLERTNKNIYESSY